MTIKIKGELMSLEHPKIMGILNVTDDSFFDGGRYSSDKDILNHVELMIEEGAHIIDVGAVSSRPGAPELAVEEELLRLLPVLSMLRKTFPDIPISIDTWRAQVAAAAVDTGADMINDISGGTFDENMLSTVAALKVPYILMHTTAKPCRMQQEILPEDYLSLMLHFFSKQIFLAHQLGVHDIILDPGFGFGKSLQQNYDLLSRLRTFEIFDLPVVVGLSRKSMIYNLLNFTPADALNATSVAHTLALMNGAKILRVHDVRAAKETIRIVQQYYSKNLN